jgi:Uma2 family endonuclease
MTSSVPFVSVEEYLRAPYSPDCDYVDGMVLERNQGRFDHSTIQSHLVVMLSAHARNWRVLVRAELRLKVRERKYRVPDVMVLAINAPRTQVIETPPLLCLEVLSPDDNLSDINQRAVEYLALGVPQTWIFDPAKKQ